MAAKTKDYSIRITDQQNIYEFSAKKKNAIYILGINQNDIDTSSFRIVGNHLLFSAKGKDFIVSDYTGIKYIKTYNTETYKSELLDIISECLVNNTNNEINILSRPNYNAKKLTLNGTNYNDVINAQWGYEPTGKTNIKKNKGLTINGGNGNDEITGTAYNDVIKGGNGNDTIEGGKGSDNITGGTGTTIVNYSKGDGDDTINLSSGEKFTLNISDLSLEELDFSYTNKNKDLKISYEVGSDKGSITLKNFAIKNVTNNSNTKKNIVDSSSVELNIGGQTYDLRTNQKDSNYWYEIKPTGNFTGGWLNDHINAKNTTEIKDRKNNHVDLVLKGGAGDDLIESSMTADKVTGGTGHNTIKYTSLDQLSGDKIYLTKGEKLDIDISEMAGATATYRVTKNDLVVTVEYNEQKEDFTIINFGTKDVTNNKTKKIDDTSNVKLITATEPDGIDLRQDIEVSTNTGTYHNDNIDRSDYDVWEDRKKTVRSPNWNKSGLTIKGGAGNDTITGTDYSDKIYGNTGTDTINAGTGNNYIYFNKGDGHDIIENGNGIDTLVFTNKTNLTYSYDKYDLIIKYSDNDTVTLKDYLKGHSVQYVQIGKTKTILNPQRPQYNEYNENGYHVIEGTVIADTIIGTDNNDKIFGNNDDDNIDGKKGSDIIDGGAGVNTYFFTSGDGNDVIVNGAGTDIIEFDEEYDLSYSMHLNGNDLIIGYGNSDSVTLQDYFVNNSHSTTTILNGNKELNITEEVAKGYSVIGTNSAETFDGTDNIPFTYVVNGGTDLIQNSKKTDTIKLNTQETISYSKVNNSNDLVITYGDNKVTIKDYFNTYTCVPKIVNRTNTLNIAKEIKNKLEIVIPENITSITGTTNNDTIHLKGSGISLIVSEGDGKDTVYSGTSEDTLVINDKTFEDISYKKQNNDLVISYSANDSVTLKNYFTEEHSVKNIAAGDDTQLLADKIKLYFEGTNIGENITGTDYQDIITAKKGNDTIDGGMRNDTYVFNTGDGTDTIINGAGTDTVKFNESQVLKFFHEMKNNDLVILYGNNDKIILQNYYVNNSHSVKNIDNNGTIISVETAITQYGMSKIYENQSSYNTIEISSYSFDDISYTRNSNDLLINWVTNDEILLKDYFNNNYTDNNHTIRNIIANGEEDLLSNRVILYIDGTDLSETINGTIYTDVINAKKGNDTIDGKQGNDTYIFVSGDGKDTIVNSQGNDSIKFNTNLDLRFSHNLQNNDLVMAYSNNDTITLQNYYVNNSHSVKTIINGTETLTVEEALNIYGIDITGTLNSENITGTSANDTIIGGKGTDIIDGGSGNNTYVFNTGDGADTIINGTGVDTIKFNITQTLTYTHDLANDDLVIGYGNSDSIILKDYFIGNSHSVKNIINGTQSVMTLSDEIIKGITITGTTGSDNIIGTIGADTIHSNGGIDTITAGIGNDEIYGGSSNSVYEFSEGDGSDTIFSGTGTDTIKINEKTFEDLSYAKLNNDLVIGYSNISSDKIVLDNFFNSTHSVKYIKSSDLETLNIENIILTQGFTISNNVITGTKLSDKITTDSSITTVNGGAGNDIITGSNGGSSITINGGVGNDILTSRTTPVIYTFNSGDGNDIIYNCKETDILKFNSIDLDSLVWNKSNDDLIIEYGNHDTLTLKDYFLTGYDIELSNGIKNSSIYRKFYINSENSTFSIRGNGRILNGTIDDHIISGEYHYVPNQDKYGNVIGYISYSYYYIDGEKVTNEPLNIRTPSNFNTNIYFQYWSPNKNYTSNSDVYKKYTYQYILSKILGNNKDNILSRNIGGCGDIIGGKGNDYLYGGNGTIFEFYAGDGNDILYTTNSSDSLSFHNINDKVYEKIDDDLIIRYNENTDSILIKNHFTNETPITVNIDNLIINGKTDATNTINGTTYNDIISGGNENDIINGALGNNMLYGGAGNDTYLISTDLSNLDTIFDELGNNDKIEISQINKDDIILRFDIQVDNDGNILDYLSKNMYITNTANFGNTTKGVKVVDQFVSDHSIEEIKTTDNYTLTTTQINQLRSDIAGWLHDNGFESVQQILDSHDETDIGNLIVEFQKANWQYNTII